MTSSRALLATGATLLGLLAAAPAASALTFTNSTPITIPAMGPASPYPSPITVSGLTGTVSDVNATITSFSHTCPSDVDILLVGPGGQKTLLFSDAGGDCAPVASGVTFTLDDEAATTYPCKANPSGTFKPTDDPTGCAPTLDAFPAPAPPGPYPVTLTVFDGTNPNGTWSLFVVDGFAGDMGTISGGWSLDLTVPTPAPTPAPTATCSGKNATIVGTPSRDTLRGTPGRDVIAGLGGKDTIVGRGGNDIICGNGGHNRIFGGPGKDRLIGGPRSDRIAGGQGRDVLIGRAGNDLLSGGPGPDKLKGGKGNDRCKGDGGKDKAKGCEKGRV